MTILSSDSPSAYATLSDHDLVTEVARLAGCERHATTQLIASIAELDARRLYLGQGCASMFTYCTQVLRLSEHAAYNRIEAARVARKFPLILERLADGSITLTTIRLLAPHLTPDNHRDLLDTARLKSKRDVEVLVAGLRPLPAVPSSVSKLPVRSLLTPDDPVAPAGAGLKADLSVPERGAAETADRRATGIAPPASPTSAASRSAVVAPLTPEQYKVQVTVGRETIEKLRRVQDLMRHTIPDGDPAVILDRALTVLLAQLERTKLAATERPRNARELMLGSRHVPAAVRRTVWARDRGQCAFVAASGRRCQERGFLEFHHSAPYAAGGEATVATIELRCRAHNLYEAELDFGPSTRRRDHREQQGASHDAGSKSSGRIHHVRNNRVWVGDGGCDLV